MKHLSFAILVLLLLVLASCGDSETGINAAPEGGYEDKNSEVVDISKSELIPEPEKATAYLSTGFWNKPMVPVAEECTGDFYFTHSLVNIEDIESIGVSPGSHIAPHDHMAYWSTGHVENVFHANGERQASRKVQIYSPADIFYIHMSINAKKEWGGYLYTCDGHAIMLGHVAEPSDELYFILSQNSPEPSCAEDSCRWDFPTFIPSGTPLFKSSGFSGGFDFGLLLAGLTAAELQQQPGYGYSITPWRTGGSGKAVCPLEYFQEPLRSEYKKFLGDFNCGPFNQDVSGTAMGFWLDSPSPDHFPGFHLRGQWEVNEWQTIWLFRDFRKTKNSRFNIAIGANMFGLDPGPQNEHSYVAANDGFKNRAWDDIKPGSLYCIELSVRENMFVVSEDVQNILMLELSEDAQQLTVEGRQTSECSKGPWRFQGMERTFYR